MGHKFNRMKTFFYFNVWRDDDCLFKSTGIFCFSAGKKNHHHRSNNCRVKELVIDF